MARQRDMGKFPIFDSSLSLNLKYFQGGVSGCQPAAGRESEAWGSLKKNLDEKNNSMANFHQHERPAIFRLQLCLS